MEPGSGLNKASPAVAASDVFAAVATEVAGLFDAPLVGLFRYEREGLATVIAGAGEMSPMRTGDKAVQATPGNAAYQPYPVNPCASTARCGRP